MISRVRAKTLIFLISAFVGLGAAPACKKLHPPRPAVTDEQVRTRLLKNLPQDMMTRAGAMLNRDYFACPKIPFTPNHWLANRISEEEQYVLAASDYLTREGKTDQMNCMATAAWIAVGYDHYGLMQGPQFLRVIGEGGFKKIDTVYPFDLSEDGFVQKVTIDLDQKGLRPGDILLFMREELVISPLANREQVEQARNNAFAHAAVYLGKEGEEHYFIAKRNSLCGENSRYEVFPFGEYLQRRVGWRVQGLDDGSYERFEVYRKP